MTHKFLTHHPDDNVGVAAVDIKAGETTTGVCLEDNKQVGEVSAVDDVPLGHKIALTEFEKGSGIVKYGVRIGSAIRKIKKGEHVHVHNLKSDRW
jgi:(2R)-sulfolactate sulfo-lyase subunit alpha